MSRWTKENFKYQIGDKVPGGTIVAYTPLIEGYGKKGKPVYKKAYYVLCNVYKKIFKRKEADILKSKSSPYQTGQIVCFENSIFKTRPDLVKYFYNKDDSLRHTKGSNRDVLLKCPECDNVFKSNPNNLSYKGFNCKMCSTGMSIGEKAMLSLIKINNIKVIKEKIYNDLKTENDKHYRFDFYLPEYNLIIEIHGEQHYKVNENSVWTSLDTTKNRDKIKKEYCNKKNIKYVVIDNRKNNIESIIKGIQDSDISYIFINKNKNDIIKYSGDNLDSYDVKNIIKDFQNGMKYIDMQNKYQLSYGIIRYTLKKYNVYKKRNNYNGVRKVRCINNNKTFDSIKDAKDWALESTNIAMCCRGERNSAGKHPVTGERLRWEYVN